MEQVYENEDEELDCGENDQARTLEAPFRTTVPGENVSPKNCTTMSCFASPKNDASMSARFAHKDDSSSRLKELTRCTVMQILRERGRRREAVKMRDIVESRRILAKWRLEETRAREEKNRQLFNRLSQTKGPGGEEAAANLNNKVEEARKRAAETLIQRKGSGKLETVQQEHVRRSNAELKRAIELRQDEYEADQRQSQETLNKVREEQEQRLRLRRERREKQILRSKIHVTLTQKTRTVCSKFWMDGQRLLSVQAKAAKQLTKDRKAVAKSLAPMEEEDPDELQPDDPEKVLLRNLSPKEICQIKDDVNYYIVDKEYRGRLPMFGGTDPDDTSFSASDLHPAAKR